MGAPPFGRGPLGHDRRRELPPGVRRRLRSVTPQDRATAGTPALFGYGYGWIAAEAQCTPAIVRRAVGAGELDPENPLAVCSWIAGKRGRQLLAVAVAALNTGEPCPLELEVDQ